MLTQIEVKDIFRKNECCCGMRHSVAVQLKTENKMKKKKIPKPSEVKLMSLGMILRSLRLPCSLTKETPNRKQSVRMAAAWFPFGL